MLRAVPAPLVLSLSLHAAALGYAVSPPPAVVLATGGQQHAMTVSLVTLPLPVPAVAAVDPARGESPLPGEGGIARDGASPTAESSPMPATSAMPAAAPDRRAARDSGAPDPAGVMIDARPVPLTTIQWPQALMDATGVRFRLRVAIDESGVPTAVDVLDRQGTASAEPVIEAVRYARFIPAMAGGRPVASTIEVEMRSLDETETFAAR